MSQIAPDLARAKVEIAARGGRLGAPLVVVAETGSTNDDAKRGAREGAPHGATWVAETQTHGRGRQGRAWISPPGENLLFSVVLRVTCPPARVPPLALVCGLAVRDAAARALEPEMRPHVLVKWPNDVVVRGEDGALRKLAGVLVESQIAAGRVENVVAGIGLNVHTREFPAEIAAVATSLALSGARAADRAAILADILASLDHDVEHVAHKGLGVVHGRLVLHDALAGRRVAVEGVSGTASGIDPDGRLLVRRDDGVLVHVASGEAIVTR
jgi:BirA family biotin operon repressor/biotin-[acetyl-CoA-carboxylase] ligase